MEMKSFAAFGYVVTRSIISAGEVINDDTLHNNEYVYNDNFLTVWLQTGGNTTHTNVSGETQVRLSGDSTMSKPLMIGKNTIVFNEETVTFCVSPTANQGRYPIVPPLRHFALQVGQSVTLPLGTKLFLASGSLDVGGVSSINGARQIHFVSGEKVCTAISDCLGFLFV